MTKKPDKTKRCQFCGQELTETEQSNYNNNTCTSCQKLRTATREEIIYDSISKGIAHRNKK